MDIRNLKAHWQDEGESAYIYKALASIEKGEQRRQIFERLAEVELRHQATYLDMIREAGESVGEWKPSARTRLLAWLARHGNASVVLGLRVADESREVRLYLGESKAETAAAGLEGAAGAARATGPSEATGGQPAESPTLSAEARTHAAERGKIVRSIAREEANHAEVLSELKGSAGEPWHHSGSGGFLRNVIYGFNDGLTANFGLVMGVIGAQVPESAVVLSGVSGLVADALSMGGSGFLAAKSEQEVWQHEIAMEREEMELMPEVETEELALLYEAKGMPAEAARKAASQVMADPEIALHEKAREELGISGEVASPMREALTTGIATACGAIIPVLPFLFGVGLLTRWISFAISMLAHFVVGAARSVFTGRGIIRSGIDMFIVGLGVAVVGFLIGALITGHL